ELEDKQEKIEELEEKRESYSNIINVKQRQAEIYDAQKKSLVNQIGTLTQEVENNKEELATVEKERDILLQDIERKQVIINVQKEVLATLVRKYYDQKQSGMILDLANTSSKNSFLASQDRTFQLQEKVQNILVEIMNAKESLERNKIEVEQKQSDLVNLRTRLEKQGEYLEVVTLQKEALLEKTLTEKGQYAWRLDKVEEEIQKVTQEIASIEASKVSRLNFASLPPAKKGLIAYPIRSPFVTQSYGMTNYAKSGVYGYNKDGRPNPHNGVDFGAPVGTPLYAVADGTVIADGDNGRYAYGKWIALQHTIDGKNFVTLYGHLSKKSVKKGEGVKEGDRIGDMGNTGNSTGPHLHFGVYSAESFELNNFSGGGKIPIGAHVDPMRYLK
ncbi:MAG: hypothetical protein EOM19_06750, partial [Candidatus Moranbacteria bacterium]|nr:hypothetical protein [Candidatus Moranbacteria bacterium]